MAEIVQITDEQLCAALSSSRALIPELEAVRRWKDLGKTRQAQVVLARSQHFMEGIEQIPQTSYTAYRLFRRTGNRATYEDPYFLKRARLAAAAIRMLLGQKTLKDIVQDYIWNICEESTWVLPAHEEYNIDIDLFSAETGYALAEILYMLGDMLDSEVRNRVRQEIERRIFEPYLRYAHLLWWYKGHNNWNGVCNSAIAATFLLLEPEQERVRVALRKAMEGLNVFLDVAFEEDGSSTEGVAYWNYGLLNFVALAEMLYARSGRAINLLGGEKMRRIAAYPATMQLSGDCFASFADSGETLKFHAGMLTRLAERTGEISLLNLLAGVDPAKGSENIAEEWRPAMLLRTLLWWAGRQPQRMPVGDAWLPGAGIVRLEGETTDGTPVVLVVKAGHNDENHNHNDIGSFILHVGGENLLTDPGRGLYNREYFGPRRYENIFTSSYGHSVPRIDGCLQSAGRQFEGTLLAAGEREGAYKLAEIEFARAYACPHLHSLRRKLLLAENGTARLSDYFHFAADEHTLEETFVTWCECEINGREVIIRGKKHSLSLTIEQPQEGYFVLERLEEQCRDNGKEGVLSRLSARLSCSTEKEFRLRMEVVV